jgi:hypothetical protein
MRFIGYLLMISGWLLTMAALLLLASPVQRLAFVIASLLVELLGLALIAQHYRAPQRGPE